MTALARAIWSLFAVSVVVLGVAGGAEAGALGAEGRVAVAAEAGAADEAGAGAAEPGAPGSEGRDCPCPSEWSDAACDDAACAPGLVQAAVQGAPLAGTDRDGRAMGQLRGLARGPEPTPPRSFG